MTNKERYKQAFSALHPSGRLSWEVEEMAMIQKKHKTNMAVAAAIACAVIIGGSGTVYAADIGGIQEKLSLWLYGEKTQVDVTENSGGGGYTFTYEHDGETEMVGGGGVSIGEDGTETWLSAGEVAESINKSAYVRADEKGRVWVYYYDQKSDITELFQENRCLISLSHDDQPIYLEIIREEDGFYSCSQTNKLEQDIESYTFVPAD